MLSLVVVVLATVATGFIVWANDKRHGKYGIALPAGVSAAVGTLSWILFVSAGLGYQPGASWKPQTQFFAGRWKGWATYASMIAYPMRLNRNDTPVLNTGMRSAHG